MRTEKHIIKNRYSTHGIHRNIPVYDVTLQTEGSGTLVANHAEGYNNTTVTMTATPAQDYMLSGYDITGATLTGDSFTLNNDVTAKAVFTVTGYIPSGEYRAWNWDGEYSNIPVKNYKITSGEYYYSPYTAASAATLDRQLFNTYYLGHQPRRSFASVVSLTVPTASIDRSKNPTYSHIRLQAKVLNGNVITMWQNTEPHEFGQESYLSSAGRYDFLFYIENSGYYAQDYNAVYISGFIDKQLFYTTAIGTESTANQWIEWARYNFGQNSPITTEKIATANAFSYASYDDAVNSIMLR